MISWGEYAGYIGAGHDYISRKRPHHYVYQRIYLSCARLRCYFLMYRRPMIIFLFTRRATQFRPPRWAGLIWPELSILRLLFTTIRGAYGHYSPPASADIYIIYLFSIGLADATTLAFWYWLQEAKIRMKAMDESRSLRSLLLSACWRLFFRQDSRRGGDDIGLNIIILGISDIL